MSNSEHRLCPACKKTYARHIGNKNGYEIFVCRLCRTLFTGHVPLEHEAENYDKYYGESNLSVPDFIVERLKEIVSEFAGYRETNRFLDIGFGAGTMLETAQRLGWEPSGIEVSKPAVDQAVRNGFNVFHGSLREAKYPDHYFDVVTASEILEHLPDPQADLSEIVRILRPGGIFWGTTPSAGGISYKILRLDWSILSPPEHIQIYSKAGAELMLKEAGFEKIRFRTHGLNPSEILNHFKKIASGETDFSRVESSYKLNESLTGSQFRKSVKGLFNGVLNMLKIGDSLKITAQTR